MRPVKTSVAGVAGSRSACFDLRYAFAGLLAGVLAACGFAGASPDLERELAARSQHGLALAVYRGMEEPHIYVRFFDGRLANRALECCSKYIQHDLARGLIVTVDPEGRDSVFDMVRGQPVVVLDAQGKIVARSAIRIISGLYSVSADRKQLAFFGRPVLSGTENQDQGLYVAGMEKPSVRKLASLPLPEHRGASQETRSLDWAPDGNRIVYSDGGVIQVWDATTGAARTIAEGHSAHWSPSGAWIAFIRGGTSTGGGRPFLIEPDTLKMVTVLRSSNFLPVTSWSPDGEYLLLVERHYSVHPCFAYARTVVYRVSDGAMLPIPCYGVLGGHAVWIQF